MFRQVNVSAPSKIILHGEHAVVYGKHAVASSLDLRTRMQISPTSRPILEVDFPDVGVRQSWEAEEVQKHVLERRPPRLSISDLDEDFLGCIQVFLDKKEEEGAIANDLKYASLTCFFYLYSLVCDDFVPMKITVESDIPIGAGLGSSAALSVCLAAGLLAIKTNENCDHTNEKLAQICNLALISEKILHGSPSGIDNSVSTYGGLIQFHQGQVEPIAPPESFQLRILLVNSNVTRSTKALVDRVKQQYLSHTNVIKPILEAIDNVSLEFMATLGDMKENGDTKEKYHRLNDLIAYNQKLLESLGVSHPRLEEAIKAVQPFGLKGKLTGAGGGGFAFILLPPYITESDIANAKEKLVKKDFEIHETHLGVNGVRVQLDNNSDCIS